MNPKRTDDPRRCLYILSGQTAALVKEMAAEGTESECRRVTESEIVEQAIRLLAKKRHTSRTRIR